MGLNKTLDYLKRRIMFWKYVKIVLNLSDSEYIILNKVAKEEGKTADEVCERALKKYISLCHYYDALKRRK